MTIKIFNWREYFSVTKLKDVFIGECRYRQTHIFQSNMDPN